MKLIIAIVLPDDADNVVKALITQGFRGATRINTVGGFLRKGNVTLLLAVEASRLEEALSLMRANVRPRTIPGAKGATPFRGAAFVVDIEQFVQT
jgi:uncharacterized protein YaaQ